jgi:hypothetical protein
MITWIILLCGLTVLDDHVALIAAFVAIMLEGGHYHHESEDEDES